MTKRLAISWLYKGLKKQFVDTLNYGLLDKEEVVKITELAYDAAKRDVDNKKELLSLFLE